MRLNQIDIRRYIVTLYILIDIKKRNKLKYFKQFMRGEVYLYRRIVHINLLL